MVAPLLPLPLPSPLRRLLSTVTTVDWTWALMMTRTAELGTSLTLLPRLILPWSTPPPSWPTRPPPAPSSTGSSPRTSTSPGIGTRLLPSLLHLMPCSRGVPPSLRLVSRCSADASPVSISPTSLPIGTFARPWSIRTLPSPCWISASWPRPLRTPPPSAVCVTAPPRRRFPSLPSTAAVSRSLSTSLPTSNSLVTSIPTSPTLASGRSRPAPLNAERQRHGSVSFANHLASSALQVSLPSPSTAFPSRCCRHPVGQFLCRVAQHSFDLFLSAQSVSYFFFISTNQNPSSSSCVSRFHALRQSPGLVLERRPFSDAIVSVGSSSVIPGYRLFRPHSLSSSSSRFSSFSSLSGWHSPSSRSPPAS